MQVGGVGSQNVIHINNNKFKVNVSYLLGIFSVNCMFWCFDEWSYNKPDLFKEILCLLTFCMLRPLIIKWVPPPPPRSDEEHEHFIKHIHTHPTNLLPLNLLINLIWRIYNKFAKHEKVFTTRIKCFIPINSAMRWFHWLSGGVSEIRQHRIGSDSDPSVDLTRIHVLHEWNFGTSLGDK